MGRRAVVVGSGPNDLAAAISLARAGIDVQVLEGAEAPGGRTEELTLPGHLHGTCSAVHPLLAASQFIGTMDLEARSSSQEFRPSAACSERDRSSDLCANSTALNCHG